MGKEANVMSGAMLFPLTEELEETVQARAAAVPQKVLEQVEKAMLKSLARQSGAFRSQPRRVE